MNLGAGVRDRQKQVEVGTDKACGQKLGTD